VAFESAFVSCHLQLVTGKASNQAPLCGACAAKNLALCDCSTRDGSMRAWSAGRLGVSQKDCFPGRGSGIRSITAYYYYSTLCLKKFPLLNSLLLCQILTNFQTFSTDGKHMKFDTKPIDIAHLTLPMLLHYIGK